MYPTKWYSFIADSSICAWIDTYLFRSFEVSVSQSLLPKWDILFRVGLRGIWRRRNSWVFSEEEVSCDGTVCWIEAQVCEWCSVQMHRLIALDDIFCS